MLVGTCFGFLRMLALLFRSNVLIEVKQVRRVVALLERYQSGIGRWWW
jgi:hypothetical protein